MTRSIAPQGGTETYACATTGPRRQLSLSHPPISRGPGLSVVVPLYNEVDNIVALVHEVTEAVGSLNMEWELLLVDDGSTDSSAELLRELSTSRVRVLRLRENRGQSVAMEVGLRAARYSLVATLDGDLQNDPRDLQLMLPLLREADMVCGVRTGRKDGHWRLLISRAANRIRSGLTGDGVSDTGCTLKLFRAEVADRLYFFKGAHRFMPALARMEGFRVTEIPVSHRARVAGVTKYGSLGRLRVTVPDLLGFLWLKSRFSSFEVDEV